MLRLIAICVCSSRSCGTTPSTTARSSETVCLTLDLPFLTLLSSKAQASSPMVLRVRFNDLDIA